MIHNTIDLYSYFKKQRPEGAKGYLTTYAPKPVKERTNRKYPAILIMPGGGYNLVSSREGQPVALEYIAKNFSAFVLEYSTAPLAYPLQLIEAAMAIIYLRENADAYFIAANKIAALGFSAGGHLCASLTTLYDNAAVKEFFGARKGLSARPDASILCYPVITSDERLWHERSFLNVSGGDKKLIEFLSLENRVTKDTPPVFLWHTGEDTSVPLENSMLFAQKLRQNGVPFELHIFQRGNHGLSVCNEKSDGVQAIDDIRRACGKWLELSVNFLRLNNIFLEN